VLVPQIDPMTKQKVFEVHNLKQSCEQAEDALTQGMEKLQETLAKTIAASQLDPYKKTKKQRTHIIFLSI
jgi:transcription factor TGA